MRRALSESSRRSVRSRASAASTTRTLAGQPTRGWRYGGCSARIPRCLPRGTLRLLVVEEGLRRALAVRHALVRLARRLVGRAQVVAQLVVLDEALHVGVGPGGPAGRYRPGAGLRGLLLLRCHGSPRIRSLRGKHTRSGRAGTSPCREAPVWRATVPRVSAPWRPPAPGAWLPRAPASAPAPEWGAGVRAGVPRAPRRAPGRPGRRRRTRCPCAGPEGTRRCRARSASALSPA